MEAGPFEGEESSDLESERVINPRREWYPKHVPSKEQ
jgi:hypothetical protein